MAYVTISDIDFERKTIHIRQSKYKKDRIVSLSKYMKKGLKQYIAVENPHIHCIVPAAGLTLAGNLKHITKQGKYLYPVRMLSAVFRGKMLEKLKRQLKQSKHLPQYQSLLDDLWRKPWVVYCEPPLENSRQIVKYLGQYSHRVAISNHRIQNIDQSGVSFLFKDTNRQPKTHPTNLKTDCK